MKGLRKPSNLAIVAMLGVAVLAFVFWTALLSPKRDELAKLESQVTQVEASLAQHQAEVSEAEAARKEFPRDYQKLVVLGKAVPGNDETASLLVQVTSIAARAGVEFHDIQLASEGEEEEAAPAAPVGSTVSATEVHSLPGGDRAFSFAAHDDAGIPILDDGFVELAAG